MTIVHPPSTDRDTNAIEHLDFAPPCEYEDCPSCTGTAAYAVLFAPSRCGCQGVRTRLFCDPCWDFVLTVSLWCRTCSNRIEPGDIWNDVLRVERI